MRFYDYTMRTTVTLDPDVEALVRRRMRESGLSFKVALNQAVVAGLGARRAPARPYRLRTYPMGFRPELDLDRALTLAAAIEDQEVLHKLSLRK